MIFSGSASVFKVISNSSTMNNTSRITQMLKNKTGRLETRGKESNFTGSLDIAELKLM
jgi:hypothetical protein